MTYVEFGKGITLKEIMRIINADEKDIILFEKARFVIDKPEGK